MNKMLIYALKIAGFHISLTALTALAPSFIQYIDDFLTQSATILTTKLVDLFNGKTEASYYFTGEYGAILNNGKVLLTVYDACNGFIIIFIYLSIIIPTKENWKKILGFSILGSLLIYIVNIIRIASLVLVASKWPDYLDFNHHYTFTVAVYSVIFILWRRFFQNGVTF